MANTIFEILKHQHDDAKEALEKLASLSEEYVAVRRENEIHAAIELISHGDAESRVLYRRLMDFAELRDHVEAHHDEHEKTNARLAALFHMDVTGPRWRADVEEVKETIERHVENEEKTLFPLARQHLDEQEARLLGERFEKEQSRRKEELRATHMPENQGRAGRGKVRIDPARNSRQ